MSRTKTVVIGAGSQVFGLGFLQDYFRSAALADSELWLVDVDGDALSRMYRLAGQLNRETGHRVELHASTEASEALPGAKFVVTSVAVDRDRSWKRDHELALEHGFPSVLSENAGPGGLSHTLRSIPVMLGVARVVEQCSPEALVINYTNPENRIALALMQHTGLRFVGLCHGVAQTAKWIADSLSLPLNGVSLTVGGVNHFNWVLGAVDLQTGTDLSNDIAKLINDRGPSEMPLTLLMYEAFGYLPTTGDNHIGEFVPWAAEIIGTRGYDFDGFRSERAATRDLVKGINDGSRSPHELLSEGSHEARVAHSGADLIADIVSGATRTRPSFIVPNNGYITGIPTDVAVEVPGLVTEGVATGVPVGQLPPPIASMVRRELDIQQLAVAAAVEGDPDLALQALLLDPCVPSARQAEKFLAAVLDVHQDLLPTFSN